MINEPNGEIHDIYIEVKKSRQVLFITFRQGSVNSNVLSLKNAKYKA